MFASNFVVKDSHLKHVRGEDKLTRFKQSNTIDTGNWMENSFCSVCGTLMYRRSEGFPGMSIPRIGTIDDFSLQETKFKPRIETFEKDRCRWLQPAKVSSFIEAMKRALTPMSCRCKNTSMVLTILAARSGRACMMASRANRHCRRSQQRSSVLVVSCTRTNASFALRESQQNLIIACEPNRNTKTY
jgi:hypothetical protein